METFPYYIAYLVTFTVKTFLKELKPDRGKTNLVPLQTGCESACDKRDCSRTQKG